MKVSKSAIESSLLGRAVLGVEAVGPEEDVAAAERAWVGGHDPVYVVAKVDAADVRGCHRFEELGFRFLEVQIGLTTALKPDYGARNHPYAYELVRDEAGFEAAARIAEASLVHDRFRTDPVLGEAFARKRHRAWVRKSFESPDEKLFALRRQDTGEVVAFKSNRLASATEAVLLLGAVDPACQQAGVGAVLDYCELEWLWARGARRALAHVSARNHRILNLEVRGLGFRVVTTKVVLRKVYGSLPALPL